MGFIHLQIECNPWLSPPDPRSLCPLSSTKFVKPPSLKNSWVRHWYINTLKTCALLRSLYNFINRPETRSDNRKFQSLKTQCPHFLYNEPYMFHWASEMLHVNAVPLMSRKTDNFFVSNQQSQYSVFHELMCWQSLTFRLSNVMSPLQPGCSRSDEGLVPKFY
jgi:hypothetical protein